VRAVRLADSAKEDIDRQLPPDRAADFKHHDLRPVLEALSTSPDADDLRDNAIVIYFIDIWTNEMPE
jgi:hypothetical protein